MNYEDEVEEAETSKAEGDKAGFVGRELGKGVDEPREDGYETEPNCGV